MVHGISFLLLVSVAAISRGSIFGKVHVRVDCFKHPFVNSTEFRCESGDVCNPKFEFLLVNSIDSTSSIYPSGRYEKAFSFVQNLGMCAYRRLSSNFPPYINLTVTRPRRTLYLMVKITEVNIFEADMLVEEMIFPLLPRLKTVYGNMDLNSSMMRLNVSNREYSHLFPPNFLNLSAVFSCGPHRYRSGCNFICKPTTRYSCDGNGSRICKPGWTGTYCYNVDYCASSPCKTWATCEIVGRSFKCSCNGRSGRQCQKGMDPCINNECRNGAYCINEKDHPKCMCTAGWIGRHCQFRDPCFNHHECAPNGNCKVVVDAVSGKLGPSCNCSSGFKGRHCKESTSGGISSQTLTIVVIVLSLVVVVLIALSLGITIMCFMRRQKRIKLSERKIEVGIGNLTYLTNLKDRESVNIDEYEDPDNAFDSSIYADPDAVYSCDNEDGSNKIEVTLHQPNATAAPHSYTGVTNSASPYCNVACVAPTVYTTMSSS